jgi:dolichyl-phosphate beta-glucosyltransferase
VTEGVLQARGKIILFSDMDQATPIEEIDKLLAYFDESYDIVIGSRNTTRKGAPLFRQFISRGAIFLRKLLIGMYDISDTQCGFKAFTAASAKPLFEKIKKIHHGFHSVSGSNVTAGFDMELLYLARKNGFTIKEVPVRWLHVETRRVNPLQDSIKGVIELLKIKSNAMHGLYSSL